MITTELLLALIVLCVLAAVWRMLKLWQKHRQQKRMIVDLMLIPYRICKLNDERQAKQRRERKGGNR